MSETFSQSPKPLLRAYLLPYVFLLLLYVLIIGCGSAWLYFTARQAQTELVTSNIVNIVSPFIKQLHEEHYTNRDSDNPFLLSRKVGHLYQALPHLRQISIRDRQQGYGVRLTSRGQLVDVELEPLKSDVEPAASHQQLALQLHQQTLPFFHIYFDSTVNNGQPVQIDVAFDRAGLVGQISDTLQSVIHSIVGFSVIGILSILLAIAIAVYTGVSTQKMEARLQKIYHQAAMGQLSASFVHDLRNPLASIRANIKNLLITPDETVQIVDELDHDLLRLKQKLADFLTLTKPVNDDFKAIDIKQLVDNLVRKCGLLFKQQHITFSTHINANIPDITGIQEDLSNALLNLLINALNHTPKNGHVWLKVQRRHEQLEIIIEDDGSGIDKSLLTKIFKPFFTTRSEGHGLGLAIVKKTIEAHNGSIHAENRTPSGARFVIHLPLNNE